MDVKLVLDQKQKSYMILNSDDILINNNKSNISFSLMKINKRQKNKKKIKKTEIII